MVKYPDRFTMYKNCRCVYIFNRQKNSNIYNIENKIKNNIGRFVSNYKCQVKSSDLNRFAGNVVYRQITSLGLNRSSNY